MISKKTIEEVFNVSIIEDVIGEFVSLKKAGANYKGLSPFSDEKTPSFVVSPSKRIWKDFSSGKGGNVVSFLMEHDACSYPDAIKYLAKKYNVEIIETKDRKVDKKQEDEKESILVLLEFSNKILNEELRKPANSTVLDYLFDRGIEKDIINKFELGFVNKSNDVFYNTLIKKGFKKETLINSGLFIENKNIFNRFSGRITFPIYSLSGRKIGFGGRVLNNQMKTAKYINSPETLVYQKSQILYGMNFAKTELMKQDNCYLVEGYLDVIALHQKNITNVVSSSGTAITKDQVRIIKRFTNTITLLFDADAAGLKAIYRAIDIALAEDMFVNIVVLPDGEDPDSFSRNNSTEDLKKYFQDNVNDFISFTCSSQIINNINPEQKIKLLKQIMNSIALVPDLTNRTIYIQKVSENLNLDTKMLLKDLERQTKKNNKSIKVPNNKKEKNKDFEPCQEEVFLFKLLLNHGEKYVHINSEKKIQVSKMILQELQLDGISVSNNVFSKILNQYQESIKKGNQISRDDFINHKDLEIANITSYLISDKYKIDNWAKKNIKVTTEEEILFILIKEALIRFKLKRITEISKEILEKIPTLNMEDKKIELNRFSKLTDLSRNLHKQIGREC